MFNNLYSNTYNMKQLFAIIVLAMTMAGCSNERKIGLFTLGQSKPEVEKILEENDFDYSEKDGRFEVTDDIEYLNIDWDGGALAFEDSKLHSVSFRKMQGVPLTKSQTKELVKTLDKVYGEHKTDNSGKDIGAKGWRWEKDNINITLTTMFDGQWGILMFFEKKDSSEIKTQAHDYIKEPSLKAPHKIWLFTIGQSAANAKEIIKKNNYEFSEDKYGLKGHQISTNYLGINWDGIDLIYDYLHPIKKKNNSNQAWNKIDNAKDDYHIQKIFFRRNKYNILNEAEKEILVKKLDEIYGGHTLETNDYGWGFGKFWKWENNEIVINFNCIDSSDEQNLELVFSIH